MFKCPKCDYRSEIAGNCPNDNEVLVEESETTPDVTPPTTDESVPTEESKPVEEK